MAVKLEIVITQRFRFYIKIYQVTVKLQNQTNIENCSPTQQYHLVMTLVFVYLNAFLNQIFKFCKTLIFLKYQNI